MKRRLSPPVQDLLLISVVVYFAVFTILLGMRTPGGDFLAIVLPWVERMSEGWHAWQLPMWDPWDFAGSPLGLAPTSQTFYLPFWLPSLFRVIDHKMLVAIHALHYFAIAWGTYFLARELWDDRRGAVLASVAFSLGTFFTSHTSHNWFIFAFAWLPWSAYFLVRGYRARAWYPVALAGAAYALSIVGGYPAVSLTFGLVITLIWAAAVWHDRDRDWSLRAYCLLVGTTILASLPTWVGLYSVRSEFTRSGPVDLDIALWGSLHPAALLSLIFPNFAQSSLFDNDPTLSACYVGVLTLLLVPVGMSFLPTSEKWQTRRRWYYVVAGLALTTWLLAFGKYTFVREFFYRFVPGFGTFQYPSLFRMFGGLTLCLLAAAAIACIPSLSDNQLGQFRRRLGWASIGGGLAFGIAFVVAGALLGNEFTNKIFVAAPFQIFFLTCVFAATRAPLSREWLARALVALAVLDSLGAFYTTLPIFADPLRRVPTADRNWAPPPDFVDGYLEHANWGSRESKFSTWGQNPFITKSLESFLHGNDPETRERIVAQGKYFLSSNLNSAVNGESVPADQISYVGVAQEKSTALNNSLAKVRTEIDQKLTIHLKSPTYVDTLFIGNLSVPEGRRVDIAGKSFAAGEFRSVRIPIRKSVTDLPLRGDGTFSIRRVELFTHANPEPAEGQVKLVRVNTSGWEFSVATPKENYLVLQDMYLDGWCAYVDDKPVEIHRAGKFFKAITVPAGEHRVDFRFRRPAVAVAFSIYVATLGSLAAWGLKAGMSARRTRRKRT